MMLGGGELADVRLFGPLTVPKFTTRRKPPEPADPPRPRLGHRFAFFRQPRRSLSHRVVRPHRLHRHLRLDRPRQPRYVILLANSVHPTAARTITPLRGRSRAMAAAEPSGYRPGIAVTGYNETLVGAGATARRPQRQLPKPASMSLRPELCNRLQRKTNRTHHKPYWSVAGRPPQYRPHPRRGIKIVAVFSPSTDSSAKKTRPENQDTNEHGDRRSHITAFIMSDRPRPTPAMLPGHRRPRYDIQDVGARFYTYSSTMLYALEEAAKAGRRVLRPGPAQPHQRNARRRAGAGRDQQSFVGCFAMPVRHGMTIGELARMLTRSGGSA